MLKVRLFKVGTKGSSVALVVPAGIRDLLGIEPGDEYVVSIDQETGTICYKPIKK